MKTAVALLTKNGGALLGDCLAAVCAQETAEPFEVLVIDSGSTDGTVERVRAEPRARLTQIPASDFQHGRTRNLAMASTTAELVAFLTQDAVPASRGWLAAFEGFMQAHPEVAGAFGHQVPHLDADPLEAWEVASHFESFRSGPVTFRAPLEGQPLAPHERARTHFFSNVNSCIRRSAWQRVPFPEIAFGEDQAWAHAAQAAGMATGYAADAVVRHSHYYGALALFGRRYDEARFMRRQFGYALGGTWRQATRAARAHAGMYRAQLREGVTPRPGASGRAWASALGHWAGTRFAQSEGIVHRMISLTERRVRP